MNFPLFSMLWAMSATVITGVLMVAALVMNFDGIPHIIGVAIVGALVALPTALFLTKKLAVLSQPSLYNPTYAYLKTMDNKMRVLKKPT